MKTLSDPILFGHDATPELVAVDLVPAVDPENDRMAVFCRQGDTTVRNDEPFLPFIVVDEKRASARGADLTGCPGKFTRQELAGVGNLGVKLVFTSWKTCQTALKWLSKTTGTGMGDPSAPWFFINDPVRQHLTTTGKTLFKGMKPEALKRLQLDIECRTSEGYEFCNAEREGDRIIAVGLSASDGWCEVLDGSVLDEKTLLEKAFALIRERDPDVIEGHNIFNFDIPYILERARRHRIKPAIGRDASVPRCRPSRLAMGERTITYTRADVFGRHIVDTLFLVQAYDLSERSMGGFGLKESAIHFGFAAKDRVYIDGSEITRVFQSEPAKVMEYLRFDLAETGAIAAHLSGSYLVQAGILPFSYQDICVRGNATKIDALLTREYLRQGRALPSPGPAREFQGGYTDMFLTGVIPNIHHCDVRSLYPSVMLTKKIGPATDTLGVFLMALDRLTAYRVEAKQEMQGSKSPLERNRLGALQKTFKILINSFYGYLGFSQGQFCDFDAAERVTAEGRSILTAMIETLRQMGARPVEIDTDGIYFMPPGKTGAAGLEPFRDKFAASLPAGIEVEFDGEYKAMFSYKMKNYALLAGDGEVIIRGAALKSRGLEPFQRSFMQEAIRLKLEGLDADIARLKEEYAAAIRGHKWPLDELAKTVTLQDSPSTYAGKIDKKSRARDAAYELALRSQREYRAGDQLTFYVTGEKKSVQVHQYAKLVSDADPAVRDENVAYYLAKLDALSAKLYDAPGSDQGQAEMAL
ncbi:MAG: DNA polymerase domain-containing protein [bacterium]